LKIKAVHKASLIGAIGGVALLGIVLQQPKSDIARRSSPTELSGSFTVPPPQAAPATVVLPTAAAPRAGKSNAAVAREVLDDFELRWQQREMEFQRQVARGELEMDTYADLVEAYKQDQENALRAVLGAAGFRSWDMQQTLTAFALDRISLTSEEKSALYELQKDRLQRLHDLERAHRSGKMDDIAFTEGDERIQAAFEQRLTGLLGPARRPAVENASDPATVQRQIFSDVHPTDSQVQALVEAERRSAESHSELNSHIQQARSLDSSYEERQHAIDAARTDDYRRILGAQAYDTFEKRQDYRYQTMMQNAGAWRLEEQRVEKVYKSIRDYDRLTNNYYLEAFELEEQGQTVDWASLDMNLAQLSRTAHESLRALLSDVQYEHLKVSGLLSSEHLTASERMSALRSALAERAPPAQYEARFTQ